MKIIQLLRSCFFLLLFISSGFARSYSNSSPSDLNILFTDDRKAVEYE